MSGDKEDEASGIAATSDDVGGRGTRLNRCWEKGKKSLHMGEGVSWEG